MRLVLAALVAALAFPAAAETDHAALARRALDEAILPGFEGLAAAAGALDAATEAACTGDGPAALEPVRSAYDETFDAWARIGHVRDPATPAPTAPRLEGALR